MTASTIELQERQVVNIADGKCLGNLKDIELNLWTGSIRSLVLPGMSGFWNRLQKSGELIVPWDKVVRIGVDVILIDMPEISQYDTLFAAGKRKKIGILQKSENLFCQDNRRHPKQISHLTSKCWSGGLFCNFSRYVKLIGGGDL